MAGNKQGMDGSYGASAAAAQEPGELDNRLSLNPNDEKFKALVGDWQDGQTYSITLTVTQVSPGEFEVMDAKEAAPAAEEAAPEGETAAEEMPESPVTSGGGNPAIQKMMQ